MIKPFHFYQSSKNTFIGNIKQLLSELRYFRQCLLTGMYMCVYTQSQGFSDVDERGRHFVFITCWILS